MGDISVNCLCVFQRKALILIHIPICGVPPPPFLKRSNLPSLPFHKCHTCFISTEFKFMKVLELKESYPLSEVPEKHTVSHRLLLGSFIIF